MYIYLIFSGSPKLEVHEIVTKCNGQLYLCSTLYCILCYSNLYHLLAYKKMAPRRWLTRAQQNRAIALRVEEKTYREIAEIVRLNKWKISNLFLRPGCVQHKEKDEKAKTLRNMLLPRMKRAVDLVLPSCSQIVDEVYLPMNRHIAGLLSSHLG